MNNKELLEIAEKCGITFSTENYVAGSKPYTHADCSIEQLAAFAAEIRKVTELQAYKDALWKACGDDEDVVNATLESVGFVPSPKENEDENN